MTHYSSWAHFYKNELGEMATAKTAGRMFAVFGLVD